MLVKNVGRTDRLIRIVIGLALITGFALNPGGSYSWLYLAGAVIALTTATLNFCGLYRIFGVSTCKID